MRIVELQLVASHFVVMEIPQWYAASLICIATCCLLARILSRLAEIGSRISCLFAKQLLYRYVLNRHALIGPWTLAFVLTQTAFFAVNVFCVCFESSDMSQMGLRAGSLASINLGLLVAAFQSDRISHALGWSLTVSQEIHRSMGMVACVLATVHGVIAVAKDRSILSSLPQHPFLLIVSQSNKRGRG